MSLVKNLPTQLWETEEENRDKGSIAKKLPNREGGLERKTEELW